MPLHIINGFKIATSNICPPVPSRDHDWLAVLDEYYDGAPDTGYGLCSVIGHGATEREAIDDLLEQVAEIEEV